MIDSVTAGTYEQVAPSVSDAVTERPTPSIAVIPASWTTPQIFATVHVITPDAQPIPTALAGDAPGPQPSSPPDSPAPPPGVTPAPSARFEQPTTIQDLELNIAIREATGPYDPNATHTAQPESISDVLAGTDWASLLRNQANPSSSRMNDNQPSVVSQIFRGTYADSVLRTQLLNQGRIPGSFVSPTLPHDYLFNPNATGLVDATLLSSHSPNRDLLDAQSIELGVSMAPILGSFATWMNPRSGWFAKTVAVLGVLPAASEIAGLRSASGLGSLATEADAALGVESEVGEASALHHIFPQEFRERFEELGIDIDQFAIRLKQFTEHIPLHVGVNTEEWAGGYNDHWAVFLDQEGITGKDAIDFAIDFLNELGLAGPEYPVVPYK